MIPEMLLTCMLFTQVSEFSEQEFESATLNSEVFDTESGNMDTIAQVRCEKCHR